MDEFTEFTKVIAEIIRELTATPAFTKFPADSSSIVILPGKQHHQPKEVPLSAFFSKIITMRERLRLLEQRIQANNLISDSEKIELQSVITRVFLALSAFNGIFEGKKGK